MKVHVQELIKGPVHIDVLRSPRFLDLKGLGFQLEKEVHLKMTLQKSKRDILGVGIMEGELLLECSRCLESFVFPFSTEIHVRFLPRENLKGSGYLDLAESDLNITYYEEDHIDLDAHIRENLILTMPMKPLCKDSCLGLCPKCGKNKNVDPCSCEREEEINPQFAVLKQWFSK